MGTPDFAVPSLDALMRAGHEIVAVYAQPPRPAGRGKTLTPTPVHARAAGAALSMLTGSLPARDGWQADPIDTAPPMADVADAADNSATIPPAKLYADLPPPDRAGFTLWWSQHRQQFALQSTLLAGQPVEEGEAGAAGNEVLRRLAVLVVHCRAGQGRQAGRR